MKFALPERHAAEPGAQILQPGGHTLGAVAQRQPGFKGRSVSVIHLSVDLGQIDLVHMVPGGEQAVGQLSVVGEQQKSLGVLVQPPDREQAPVFLRQKVQHGLLPPVFGGSQHTAGLVEHQVAEFCPDDLCAIHFDALGRWVHFALGGAFHLSVHAHTALLQQQLGLFAGPAARVREQLVQPQLRCHAWFSLPFCLPPQVHTLCVRWAIWCF